MFVRKRFLERLPIGWSRLIEKELLEIKELEHVLIEKFGQLFRNMLQNANRSNAAPRKALSMRVFA